MESTVLEKLERKTKKAFGPSVEDIRRLADAEDAAAQGWLTEIAKDLPFAPDIAYWEVWEAWAQAYNPRTLPIAHREMEEMIAAQKAFMDPDPELSPDSRIFVELANRFTASREPARRACFTNPVSRADWQATLMKTPTELNAAKVALRTIAYEWRWLIQRDSDSPLPDVYRVQRELDNPGSELTEKVIAARYQFYLLQMGFVYVPPESDEDASPVEKKPDVPASTVVELSSIEALVRERVGVDQIVAVKCRELGFDPEAYEHKERVLALVTAVRATAAALGITLPANAREQVVSGAQPMAPAKFPESEVAAS